MTPVKKKFSQVTQVKDHEKQELRQVVLNVL